MQDELTKHGLKIYKTMSDKKHSFGEKLKEIIIEIGIIVFAVTLSIYVHSWSEHRHEQKEVREFLRGLKTDLTNDLAQLKDNRDSIAKIATLFNLALQHRKDHLPDSILGNYFYYSLVVTNLNTARYEGFKSSGKIGNIENDSLREHILVYYQQMAPGITEIEGLVNSLQQKLLDSQTDRTTGTLNDFLTTRKTLSLLQLSIENIHGSIHLYDSTAAKANTLVKTIETELTQ